jgi:hypothetical protein
MNKSLCADSEEKHESVDDIDTEAVDDFWPSEQNAIAAISANVRRHQSVCALYIQRSLSHRRHIVPQTS